MTPPRSVAAAAKEALDILAAEWWPILLVTLLPELACVAVKQAFWALLPSHFSQIDSPEALALLIAHGVGTIVAVLVAVYLIRAFGWAAICELLAQRSRDEPRRVLVAWSKALAGYGAYLRTYTAFLIPAASVGVSLMLVSAALFFAARDAVLGWGTAIGLVVLSLAIVFPFWLWAEGFANLVSPAAVEGQFGLQAYEAMRARLAGRALSVVGLFVIEIAAGIAASITGWLLGLAIPSSAAPDTDWQKFLTMTPDDLPKLFSEVSFASDRWELAHAAVSAIPDALVFGFIAVTAWRWLRVEKT